MAVNYPQKKTIYIAVICTVAVLGSIVYTYTNSYAQNGSKNNVIATPEQDNDSQQNIISSTSTDWKKQFLGQSTSTSAITDKSILNNSTNDTPKTLTDKMSKELFSRFIELKQNGLDNNQQLIQDAINQTLDNTLASAAQPKQYTLKDINISDKISSADYHDYGNSVSLVLANDMPKDNAPTIAENAFEASDMNLLSGIDPVISDYQTVLKNLLSTKVPRPIAQYHTNLINSISFMLFISQNLRNLQADPMQSMVAIKIYSTANTVMQTSLINIHNYFDTNKIIFSANEPGQLFSTLTQ